MKINNLILIIIRWILRVRPLHLVVGVMAASYLFWELGIGNLPYEANPDYNKIAEEYGELVKVVIGYIVDNFASGTNYFNVIIASVILLICVFVHIKELRLKSANRITKIINPRIPYIVNSDFFKKLKNETFTADFSSKYNKKLFVDQDREVGNNIIKKIVLKNQDYSYLVTELRILKEWINDFIEEYKNLKSILEIEKIPINKKSKQYKQLEELVNKSEDFLKIIKENKINIDSNFTHPQHFKFFDITNLETPLGFDLEKINEYKLEDCFIRSKPADNYQVIFVFRRLTQISTQLKSLNRLISSSYHSQVTFIHGDAGMGKSNLSVFIFTELEDLNELVIILSGKSFNGDPDDFDGIIMDKLFAPKDYMLGEILGKLNEYGQNHKSRVTIIIDGLNETSYKDSGFSKIWENSLDYFINKLKSYPYLHLVATLRTSYVFRIWGQDKIPHNHTRLSGFDKSKIWDAVQLYFDEYRIKTQGLTNTDIFYFKTPLYLDLYCKMLNGDKATEVKPHLGLDGFSQVFDRYLNKLKKKTQHKLELADSILVDKGISRVSERMIKELEAFIPKLDYFELMEGKKVKTLKNTIGFVVLEEYLIYLDDNINNKDVIVHTQQEVGGYLLANHLISENNSVDAVVNSKFFQDFILGESGKYHQLKDDILKFLLVHSGSDSLLLKEYIEQPIVKRFTALNLSKSKNTKESKKIASLLLNTDYSLDELRILLNDSYLDFYNLDANINFSFIKQILLRKNNYELDLSWSYFIYNNTSSFDNLLGKYIGEIVESDSKKLNFLDIEVSIWLLETTVRELRDKSTRFLILYFERFPEQILSRFLEFADKSRVYIKERLALIAYGVCMRLQNDDNFIKNHLSKVAPALYKIQFDEKPSNPVYNYIIIDSYKHIIDLAVIKGVFNLSEKNLKRLSDYSFAKDDWFDITQSDINKVPIASNWSLSSNPDPLKGDFVHYTIPRLDNRDHENRIEHTANIFKEIKRLGYKPNDTNLDDSVKSFYSGVNIIGYNSKVDRLGKKYSWMAYFNYAGFLLENNKLGVWSEGDTSYTRHYTRLSDTEIEPSYDNFDKYDERLIHQDFFADRVLDSDNWIKVSNFDVLNELYENEEYTLLSALVDQKLDEKYKTRSWVEAIPFFVNKKQVQTHIKEIQNKNYNWKQDLHDNNMLSKTYFGELYWADTVPVIKKGIHNLPLDSTKVIKRKISFKEVRESGKFNYSDIGKEITETVNETCNFEYEPALMDFLWETDSEQIPTLRCNIPSSNLGKILNLTVDSKNTRILDSDLKICFKEYYTEYGLNSQNFHYFRTDLLKKYLKETDQLLMYQLKQHTYDQATDAHHEHFRGMQFVFSKLNQ